MKTFYLKRSIESVFGKCRLIITACNTLLFFSVIAQVSSASAQVVLFDFDNAPLHAPLPIALTVNGITAHFSATGQGYSIQDNSAPVVPLGFTGRFIYPSSINSADLLVRFDQSLTDFSIMYSVQELACDTSATMRVTAYMNGSFVGTNTKVASIPGTWPVDTLRCSFPQGFDSVVVHFDSHPSRCQDWGPVFLADNMRVTLLNSTAVSEGELPDMYTLKQNYPNPFNPSTTITFSIGTYSYISLRVYDVMGREVATIVSEKLPAGNYSRQWNAAKMPSGIYFYRLQAGSFRETKILILLK